MGCGAVLVVLVPALYDCYEAPQLASFELVLCYESTSLEQNGCVPLRYWSAVLCRVQLARGVRPMPEACTHITTSRACVCHLAKQAVRGTGCRHA